MINYAQHILDAEMQGIQMVKKHLDDNFLKTLDILYNCKGMVVVMGMGKSEFIGQKISATLSLTGTPSFFLSPAHAIHGNLGSIKRNAVVLMISKSGETYELLQILPKLNELSIETILLTCSPQSTLSKNVKTIIDIKILDEACPFNLIPTVSTTSMLALGDAISLCLMKKKQLTKEHILTFHPASTINK